MTHNLGQSPSQSVSRGLHPRFFIHTFGPDRINLGEAFKYLHSGRAVQSASFSPKHATSVGDGVGGSVVGGMVGKGDGKTVVAFVEGDKVGPNVEGARVDSRCSTLHRHPPPHLPSLVWHQNPFFGGILLLGILEAMQDVLHSVFFFAVPNLPVTRQTLSVTIGRCRVDKHRSISSRIR